MSEDTIKVTIEGENDEPKVADRASEAESKLASALAERDEMLRRAHEAEIVTVENRYETARVQAAESKAAYARAFESGDINAMAESIEALSDAKLKAAQLEAHHESLKRRPPDPVEAWIASKSAPAQKWLKEHREFVTDRAKNARLNAGHYDAVASGITPDTPEYFTHVERHIGLNGNNGARNGGGVRHMSPAEKSRVNPNDPDTHLLDNGTVYLTKGEARSAQDGTHVYTFGPKKGQPIGLVEMSRRKAALIKQGAYRKLDQ